MGLFAKIKNVLSKTKEGLTKKLNDLFAKNKLGEEFYEELEEILVMADVGVNTATEIVEKLRDSVFKKNLRKAKDVKAGSITLGVRPEHFTLASAGASDAIECQILVNEMMGSELHLHVVTNNGDKLIVRIPTVSLTDDQRNALVAGATINVTFEGKVMHFFDTESQMNLLV